MDSGYSVWGKNVLPFHINVCIARLGKSRRALSLIM